MAQLNLVRKMMLIPIFIVKTYPLVLMFIMILTPILVSKKFMLMKTQLLMMALSLLEMLLVKLDLVRPIMPMLVLILKTHLLVVFMMILVLTHISVLQKFMLVVKPVLFQLRKLIFFQNYGTIHGQKHLRMDQRKKSANMTSPDALSHSRMLEYYQVTRSAISQHSVSKRWTHT